jgi:hypothetical protein
MANLGEKGGIYHVRTRRDLAAFSVSSGHLEKGRLKSFFGACRSPLLAMP